MAGTGLLALLDDIATLLDDVAVLTKVAARKTSAVLGDDLALNAEQATGVSSDRELAVVWGVAKGAMLNKVILVPAALAISALVPWAVLPLLMLGGAFLCYEGFHKVVEKFFHKKDEAEKAAEVLEAAHDPEVDLVAFEKEKIKGAIRTDFILSAEVIVITLGVVAEEPLKVQVPVLLAIAAAMVVVVYGLVAAIVKLDDLGLALTRRDNEALQRLGRGIVATAPWLMRFLGVAGTLAMFLVGGGIVAHGIPPVEHFIEAATAASGPLAAVVPSVLNGLVGVIVGALIVGLLSLGKKVTGRGKEQAH